MKVLMINSVSGYGSTGSICVDIAMELEAQGLDCYIAYGQMSLGYPKGFKIGSRLGNHLHAAGRRFLGKQGYCSQRGTKDLIKFIKEYDPDVIHLHNLHGNYLNLELLFKYLTEVQKPVVWTLHDCWSYTGRCAYYSDLGCEKWKTACHHCPQLDTWLERLFLDKSRSSHIDKKKWFTQLNNATILPVSNWLAGEVQQSLLNIYPIVPVYNWVDHSIFRPMVDSTTAAQYNLDPDKFTVICVSAYWADNTVRYNDLIEFATALGNEYQIIVIGKLTSKGKLPDNCIAIPYIDGRPELAKLYTFADVYLHLSTEDTFGLVIAEAMSCGTPVIVNNVTACPEIAGPECGFIIESRNNAARITAVREIQNRGKMYYSSKCRERVLQNFDMKSNINHIINVYKNVLH